MTRTNAWQVRLAMLAALGLPACGGIARRTAADASDTAAPGADQAAKRDVPEELAPPPRDGAADLSVGTGDGAMDTPERAPDGPGPGPDSPYDVATSNPDAGIDGPGRLPDTQSLDTGREDLAPLDAELTAVLIISPSMASFSEITGTTSSPILISVANVGQGTSGSFIFNLTGTDAADFAILNSTCVGLLPAGRSCQVALVFKAPSTPGVSWATLSISVGGAAGQEFAILLAGEANPPGQPLDASPPVDSGIDGS
jgi:hypothetical protein